MFSYGTQPEVTAPFLYGFTTNSYQLLTLCLKSYIPDGRMDIRQ